MGGALLKNPITLLRYRFFLFAGLLPYVLGSALGAKSFGHFSLNYFLIGLLGLFFVLVGIESFNEYFDWKSGGDRVFFKLAPPPKFILPLGVFSFLLAGLVAVYFAFSLSPIIWLFVLPGFLGAAFYVAPPFKWAYLGLGEVVIGLCYGPGLVLGGFFLQTGRVSLEAVLVSLTVGLLMFSLAIANEIPDFYQDRLVGKRNLVVRLGQGKALWLYRGALFFVFALIGVGMILKLFSWLLAFSFLLLPISFRQIKLEQLSSIVAAIRRTLLIYLALLSLMFISSVIG